MKSIFVKDLQVGGQIEDIFVLSSVNSRSYSGGKLINLRIADRTGKANCVIWNPPDEYEAMLRAGLITRIRGKVGRYGGDIQVTVQDINVIHDLSVLDPVDFLPSSPVDPSELENDILEFHKGLNNEFLSSLWQMFFDDEENYTTFKRAPAGKRWHHAYLGGLMEHTRNVMRICDFLGRTYEELDRDLLLTGALFHDFGKVMELSAVFSLDYTDEGRLIGHLFLGAEKVRQYMRDIPDFPKDLENMVTHLILAHHDEQEGTVKKAMTREALLLHFSDNMDAQYNAYSREMERIEDPDVKWTNYISLIQRALYRGAPIETVSDPRGNGGQR